MDQDTQPVMRTICRTHASAVSSIRLVLPFAEVLALRRMTVGILEWSSGCHSSGRAGVRIPLLSPVSL